MLPSLELARGALRFLAVAIPALIFSPTTCDTGRLSPVNIDPPKTPVDEQTDGGLATPVSFAKAGASLPSGGQ